MRKRGRSRRAGGPNHPLLQRIIEVGVLCNNASLRDADNDREPDEEQGDPTETALLRAGFMLDIEAAGDCSKKNRKSAKSPLTPIS